jgi:hypothetical protein
MRWTLSASFVLEDDRGVGGASRKGGARSGTDRRQSLIAGGDVVDGLAIAGRAHAEVAHALEQLRDQGRRVGRRAALELQPAELVATVEGRHVELDPALVGGEVAQRLEIAAQLGGSRRRRRAAAGTSLAIELIVVPRLALGPARFALPLPGQLLLRGPLVRTLGCRGSPGRTCLQLDRLGE